VNGQVLASQAMFEPYGIRHRVEPYDVRAYFRAGSNEVEVHLADLGFTPVRLVDARVLDVAGHDGYFFTDSGWQISRDGVPVRTDGAALPRSPPTRSCCTADGKKCPPGVDSGENLGE